MKASVLLEALLTRADLPQDDVQAIYDQLPETARLTDFRNAIVDAGILSFSEVMNVFVKEALIPKSEALLTKLDHNKQNNVHFKPKQHKQKYHIRDDDHLEKKLTFSDIQISLEIPEPDIANLQFVHSDEKQAIMLALDMIQMNELAEVEIILLETLESFEKSTATAEILAWLYLCTGHMEQSETSAKNALKKGLADQQIIELLALAEQLQNKHLLATAHYQKLLQLDRVKSLWYLLMAYSQQHSNCMREAAENYKIYATIGKNPDFQALAVQQLQAIKTQ